MARRKNSNGNVLFHFILGLLTGGLWWVWLFIKFLRANS